MISTETLDTKLAHMAEVIAIALAHGATIRQVRHVVDMVIYQEIGDEF